MFTQGGLGAVFAYASYVSDTIAFHENGASPDTIEDSASQFLAEGYVAGMVIAITGSASNNKSVTIATLTASLITLIDSDDLTEEAAGATVTMATATQGSQLVGFDNQTIDTGIKQAESNTYENYPFEKFEVTIKNGKATLSRFWTTSDPNEWLGRSLDLRLFLRYSASPSASDPAIYHSGTGKIIGENLTADVGELQKGTIEVVFSGAITPTNKTTAW